MRILTKYLRAILALSPTRNASGRFAPSVVWALLAWHVTLVLSPSLLANPFVRMDYNLFTQRARGTVFIELFDDRPLTRDNFLAYVNSGKYDNTLMHRMVRNFVLQGGGFYPDIYTYPPLPGGQTHPLYTYMLPDEVDFDDNPSTPNPTVDNEFGNLPFRSNVTGTLAMAKVGGDPDSATSEYFFNLNNNAGTCPLGLDCQNGGFTVFAKVVGDGMNLLNAYNSGLPIYNLNYDADGDLTADDPGVFSSVPALGPRSNYFPLVLLNADRIDYIGAGSPAVDLTGGLLISTRDAYFDTGTTFSNSGEITVAAGRSLGVREGSILAGRSVVNFGTFEPGLQIGQVNLQAFRQEAGATLQIELNGLAVDTGYDRIAATAGILLGGDLEVSTYGYQPSAGESYTFLTAGTAIVGDFSNIDLFELRPGYVWNVSKTLTAYTLKVDYADFNHDGVVDAGDYVMWRKLNNPSVAITAFTSADGNGDGFVNDLDYDVWFRNIGNTRGGSFGAGGSAAVPEPASLALLFSGWGFIVGRRCRRECRL